MFERKLHNIERDVNEMSGTNDEVIKEFFKETRYSLLSWLN